MSSLDKVDQQRAQMARFYKDYTTLAQAVGTDKDSAFTRTKIARLRERYAEADRKAQGALSAAPASGPDAAEWAKMRLALRDQKAEWDRLDRDVKARELSNPIQTNSTAATPGQDYGTSGAGGAATSGGGHAAIKITEFRQIDDAELNTEDAVQAEKLKGIIEVESNVNELRAMYHEFHGHVEGQQEGLNRTEGNIDKAQGHVEKGVKELKSANKLQKSSRKKMCILLGIIIAIVVVVVIVVVVIKK